MARIQNPRFRAITEPRRGWKPTPRPPTPPPGSGGGGGGNRNTPAASFTPPPLTPPEADPGYMRIKGILGPTLGETRKNIDAQQEALLMRYGLGRHIKPGTGEVMTDAQGLITGYKPGTGIQHDYSLNNPESLAARLQRSFEQGMRGTRNSLAARGLRRSGALDRQEAGLLSERTSSEADLRFRLGEALSALEGDYARAYRDVAFRLSDALGGAIDRQVAAAPPAAASPASRGGGGGSSVATATVVSKPQKGGRSAGKGKQKVGIGGAQRVRRLRMRSQWR